MKEEKQLVWNDELVKEFGRWTKNYKSSKDTDKAFEDFKFSKLNQSKPIVVDIEKFPNHYFYKTEPETAGCKISKERLAEILIAENKKFICIIDEEHTLINNNSVIKELEECFNESRKTHPIVGFKYDTFSDYANLKIKEWTK